MIPTMTSLWVESVQPVASETAGCLQVVAVEMVMVMVIVVALILTGSLNCARK